jgi:hypothetical protein
MQQESRNCKSFMSDKLMKNNSDGSSSTVRSKLKIYARSSILNLLSGIKENLKP